VNCFLDVLEKLTNIQKLNLECCESLQNVDGLSKLKILKS